MSAIDSTLAIVWFIVSSVLVIWVICSFEQCFTARMCATASVVLIQWKVELFTGLFGPHTNCALSYLNKTYCSYGEVDYIYGWKAYNEHNGFTNAQSALNLFEVLLQIYFLWLRKVPGRQNKALLIGYTVSVMTLSKTVLYWLQEYYSGFLSELRKKLIHRYADIGHNSVDRLILLWIIPNGVWIVVPAILVKQFGAELMQKLNAREMKQK